MKNRNWFWGGFFILSAALLVVSGLGWFQNIGFWSILATVLLAAVVVQSIAKRSVAGVLVPVALLYGIYQRPLDLPHISVWLLLFAAILASIGIGMIFRPKPHYQHLPPAHIHSHGGMRPEGEVNEGGDDDHPFARVRFSSTSKYLHSQRLESGEFSILFGSLELFFDGASMNEAGAEVFVDCSFSTLRLYIPRTWRVIDNMNRTMGTFSDAPNAGNLSPGAPALTLSGRVEFGSVEIIYV